MKFPFGRKGKNSTQPPPPPTTRRRTRSRSRDSNDYEDGFDDYDVAGIDYRYRSNRHHGASSYGDNYSIAMSSEQAVPEMYNDNHWQRRDTDLGADRNVRIIKSGAPTRSNSNRNRNSNSRKKKTMGEWVKKLNCAASSSSSSKKNALTATESNRHDLVHSVRKRDPSKTVQWGPQQEMIQPSIVGADVARPVLITVNDGVESPEQTSPGRSNLRDSSSSPSSVSRRKRGTGYGQAPGSPSRNGSSSPSRRRFGSRLFQSKKDVTDSPPRSLPRRSSNNHSNNSNRSRDMHDLTTPQEQARKNRWRRAFERKWRDDSDIPSLVSGCEDESTIDGGRSEFTGFDTVGTGTTGYTGYTGHTGTTGYTDEYTTDETEETDDSDDSDDYDAPPRRGGGYGGTNNSPPRIRRTTASTSATRGSKLNTQTFLAGVAEDMGIIAGLLLSDGSACFSGVAQITQETLSSCKPEV